MKYFEIKKRISDILVKDNLDQLIAAFVNEAREEAAIKQALRFLFTRKTIDLTTGYEYAIDNGESSGRYSGHFKALYFDDNSGNTPTRLAYLEEDEFENVFPHHDQANDPSVFTIRGNNFIVNYLPSTITDKTFIASYYALPDVFDSDSDEDYMSKNYYNYIIHRVCFRMYQEIIELGEANKSSYHLMEYQKDYDRMLLKEGVFSIIDTPKNVF